MYVLIMLLMAMEDSILAWTCTIISDLVYSVYSSLIIEREKPEIIDLEDFLVALQWLGEDIDMDELECILVNLIYKVCA